MTEKMKFLLGHKIEMSQMFDEKGKVIPVTLIKAGPCFVTQIKNEKDDGYESIQIGFEKIEKKNKIKKTMKAKEYKVLREYRARAENPKSEIRNPKPGDKIDVSVFEKGEKVKISGISKGKGFAGGVKRHGFKTRAKAHGSKDMRKIGSTGARWPQRVIKGKKMPGRMGTERISVKNLEIIKIDKENNMLAIKGAIPGHRGTLVEIKSK